MQTLATADYSESEIIHQAAAVIAAGGLVIFPTETVYGAGVDATNRAAVDKLLAFKSRREGKPLSIAVTDLEMASKYVVINDQARKLYERFLPGPVTVVSQGKHVLAAGVESEFGTLGVRIPDYLLIVNLVAKLGKPITATSANGSGAKRPYSISDIFDELSEAQKGLIDLVIDAGTLPTRPPSTVIDTTLSAPVTLRQGEVDLRSLSQLNESQSSSQLSDSSSSSRPQRSEVEGSLSKSKPALILKSSSESDTIGIAGRLLLKNWDIIKEKGLVIGLDGSLGMGKTVFTKGVAAFLNISETITSPTYTYCEEYPYERHQSRGSLIHVDAWKVDTADMWHRLEVEKMMGPGKVVVIEWWSQVAAWVLPASSGLIQVKFSEGQSPSDRLLSIIER